MFKTVSFGLLLVVLLLGAPLTVTAQPTVTLTVGDANAAEAAQDTGSFRVTLTDDGNTAASLSMWLTVGGKESSPSTTSSSPSSRTGSKILERFSLDHLPVAFIR